MAGTPTALTGVYTWRVKFKNSVTGALSEPGFKTGADGVIDDPVVQLKSNALDLTGVNANKKANLSTIPVSPDPQVDRKELYRTLAGGDGVWYFVIELANATTTYTDEKSDALLGAVMREFLDEPIPDSASVVALWTQANRLIAILPDIQAVAFSDQFDLETGFLKGESWPPDNLIFVNYDDGDPLRGIAVFYDSVLIFKERSVWRIDGIPPDITISAVSFRADLTGVGALGPKAIAIDQDQAMFLAQDGLYSVGRRSYTDAFQSQRLSAAIDDQWGRLTVPQRDLAHLVYYRRRRQLRCWLPVDGQTEPSQGLVYQIEGQPGGAPHGWSLWNIVRNLNDFRATASCIGQSDTGDICYLGSDRGDVVEMDTGTADLETYPYEFDYTTMAYAPGGMGRPCRMRAVDFSILAALAGTLTVEGIFDFGDRVVQKTVAFAAAGGFTLDSSRLDVDTLGGSRARLYNRVLLGRGEYHQLRFTERSNLAAFYLMAFNEWIQVLSAPALNRMEG